MTAHPDRSPPCQAAAAAALRCPVDGTAPRWAAATRAPSPARPAAAPPRTTTRRSKCTETLGTLAMREDANAPWYVGLREHQLG